MYDGDSETIALLRAIRENTREIADLLEVGHGAELRRRLASRLTDERKRSVYQQSIDDISARDLAKAAGVSDKTVRDWWKEWFRAGLLRPAATEGRYQRKYDLDRLALGEEGSS